MHHLARAAPGRGAMAGHPLHSVGVATVALTRGQPRTQALPATLTNPIARPAQRQRASHGAVRGRTGWLDLGMG